MKTCHDIYAEATTGMDLFQHVHFDTYLLTCLMHKVSTDELSELISNANVAWVEKSTRES